MGNVENASQCGRGGKGGHDSEIITSMTDKACVYHLNENHTRSIHMLLRPLWISDSLPVCNLHKEQYPRPKGSRCSILWLPLSLNYLWFCYQTLVIMDSTQEDTT